MKKILLISLVCLIIILDWLALDDITTGKEPGFLIEYLVVFASIPVLVLIGYFLFKGKLPFIFL